MIIIPASDNFLKRVSEIVLEKVQELDDPMQVLQMRVYLPNNRSCRILKEHIVSAKKTLILPKILTPFDAANVSDQIREVIKIMANLDNNTYITARFNLACSLFSELKNIVQEKLPLDEAISISSNPQIANLLLKLDFQVDMSSIEENTQYVKQTNVPCICAGFTYSHAYLRDFLKAASDAKRHILIFQGNPDIYGLSQKLLKYIGCENDINIKSEKLDNAKINLIEPPNKLNEIKTIATIVRSNIGKKITIIYTDKSLIAGVKAYLQKWNINIDDSSGMAFNDTREATIFLLLLQAVISKFAINETLELLKYITPGDFNKIEKSTLLNKINFSTLSLESLFDNNVIITYFTRMSSIFYANKDILLQSAMLEECFLFILKYLELRTSDIIQNIFKHLHELLPYISSLSEYYSLAIKIMDMYSCRSPFGYTPNIIAVGPLEAQIINSDVTIIAGFNDKNWIVDSSSYLLNGHESLTRELNCRKNNDIYNTLYHAIKSSEEVFITNAVVDEGTQQKLCRLLYSFFKQDDIDLANKNGSAWTFEDTIAHINSRPPIATLPQLYHCPNTFSVSDIELLMNNPYAFYAKKILKLSPLYDILDPNYANRLRGIILHKALKSTASKNSNNIYENILSSIKTDIKLLGIDKYYFLDWIFKIKNIASYVSEYIKMANYVEYPGSIELNVENQVIRIKCIADMIIREGNQVTIIDYKTGSLPTYQDILSLNKPQMLIEALIAQKNGFYNINNCSLNRLMFVQLGGTRQSLKTVNLIDNKVFSSINSVIQRTEEKISTVMRDYIIELKPFLAVENKYYNEYSHLAREKEWTYSV